MAVAAYCEGGIHCICEKSANKSNKTSIKGQPNGMGQERFFFLGKGTVQMYTYTDVLLTQLSSQPSVAKIRLC